MSNILLNNLSVAVYTSLLVVGASADIAMRIRGRRPRASITWR